MANALVTFRGSKDIARGGKGSTLPATLEGDTLTVHHTYVDSVYTRKSPGVWVNYQGYEFIEDEYFQVKPLAERRLHLVPPRR